MAKSTVARVLIGFMDGLIAVQPNDLASGAEEIIKSLEDAGYVDSSSAAVAYCTKNKSPKVDVSGKGVDLTIPAATTAATAEVEAAKAATVTAEAAAAAANAIVEAQGNLIAAQDTLAAASTDKEKTDASALVAEAKTALEALTK